MRVPCAAVALARWQAADALQRPRRVQATGALERRLWPLVVTASCTGRPEREVGWLAARCADVRALGRQQPPGRGESGLAPDVRSEVQRGEASARTSVRTLTFTPQGI